MNLSKYKFILLFLFASFYSFAEKGRKEFTKVIKESVSINSGGEIYIENQFGNINIETNDGNRVELEVTITIDERTQAKADDVFDRIDIEIDHTSSSFDAETYIGSPSWWDKVWSNDSNNKISIDYKMTIPRSCLVELSNRHGDIFLGNIDNDVAIDLQFGDAQLSDIKGDLELELAHGKVTATSMGEVDLDMQYGTFKCDKTLDISGDTQFSKVFVTQAGVVEVDTQYDEYDLGEILLFSNDGQFDDIKIGSVKEVEVDVQYSDISIEELTTAGDFETQFGSLYIRDTGTGLKEITIDSQYTGINLWVDVPFQFDIEAQFGDIKLMDGMNVSSMDKEIGEYSSNGYYLSNREGAIISVDMEFGHLKFK